MNTKYFYLKGSVIPQGPCKKSELKSLLKSGQIDLDTMVAVQGVEEWKSLSACFPKMNDNALSKFNFLKAPNKIVVKLFCWLCAIAIIGGVLLQMEIINTSMFLPKGMQYDQLVDDMKESNALVLEVKNARSSSDNQLDLSDRAGVQLKGLLEVKKKFNKLGIPSRTLQAELREELFKEDQLSYVDLVSIKMLGTELKKGDGSAEFLKTYIRIVEDYLLSDDELKKPSL